MGIANDTNQNMQNLVYLCRDYGLSYQFFISLQILMKEQSV